MGSGGDAGIDGGAHDNELAHGSDGVQMGETIVVVGSFIDK